MHGELGECAKKILRDVLRTEAMPTNHILVNPLSDQQLLAENGDRCETISDKT